MLFVVDSSFFQKGGGFPREEIKRQALALNMTRAIGHPVLSQYGVSPEPEFQTAVIGNNDRLILASDGLWDVMQNEEAALFCSYRSSANKCAQGLLKVARSKYQKNRMRADNTTICVGYVTSSGEASAPSSQPSLTPEI
jgi:serine/threonine protein phosphatase PrpC